MMTLDTLDNLVKQFIHFSLFSKEERDYRVHISKRISLYLYETYQVIFQASESSASLTELERIQKYQDFLKKASNDFSLHDIHASKETQAISQLLILIAIGVSENLKKRPASLDIILKTLIPNLKVIPGVDDEKESAFLIKLEDMPKSDIYFKGQYDSYRHNSDQVEQNSEIYSYYSNQISLRREGRPSDILVFSIAGISNESLTLMLKISQILHTNFFHPSEGESLEIELLPLSLLLNYTNTMPEIPFNPYSAAMANNSTSHLSQQIIDSMSNSHAIAFNLLVATNKLNELKESPTSLYSYLYNIKTKMHDNSVVGSGSVSEASSIKLSKEIASFCQYFSTLDKESTKTLPTRIFVEILLIHIMAGDTPTEEQKKILLKESNYSEDNNLWKCLAYRASSIEHRITEHQQQLIAIGSSGEEQERAFSSADSDTKEAKERFLKLISKPGFKREQSLKITGPLILKIKNNQLTQEEGINPHPFPLILQLNPDEVASILSTPELSDPLIFNQRFMQGLEDTESFSNFFIQCNLEKLKLLFKKMGKSLWEQLTYVSNKESRFLENKPTAYSIIFTLLDSLKDKTSLFLTAHYIQYLFLNSPESIQDIRSHYFETSNPILSLSKRGRLYFLQSMLHFIPTKEKNLIYFIIQNELDSGLKKQQIELVMAYIKRTPNLHEVQDMVKFISTQHYNFRVLYKGDLKELVINALNAIDDFSNFNYPTFIEILRSSPKDSNEYILDYFYEGWKNSEHVKYDFENLMLILKDAHEFIPLTSFEKIKNKIIQFLHRRDNPSSPYSLDMNEHYNNVFFHAYIKSFFKHFTEYPNKPYLRNEFIALMSKLTPDDIKTFITIILSNQKDFPLKKLGTCLTSLRNMIMFFKKDKKKDIFDEELVKAYTGAFINKILPQCKASFSDLPTIFSIIGDEQREQIMDFILNNEKYITSIDKISTLSKMFSYASEPQKTHLFDILSNNLTPYTPKGYPKMKVPLVDSSDKQLNALFKELTSEQVKFLLKSSPGLKEWLSKSKDLTPKVLIKSLPAETQRSLLLLFKPSTIIDKISTLTTAIKRKNAISSLAKAIAPELRREYFQTLLNCDLVKKLSLDQYAKLKTALLNVDFDTFTYVFNSIDNASLSVSPQPEASAKRDSEMSRACLFQYQNISPVSHPDSKNSSPPAKKKPT